MLTLKDFYERYDEIAPNLFKHYQDYMQIGAEAIPKNTKSVCDLGIGTGNFSREVNRINPDIEITGVDLMESTMQKAKEKIPSINLVKKDIFQEDLPKADLYISGLTMHHLDDRIRREKLMKFAIAGKGLIIYDWFLMNGKTKEDLIEEAISFAKRSYPDHETHEQIRNEIKANDNPMDLEEARKIFESIGMEFKILAKDFPFAVYSALWPTKKL